ncbi:MAG: hypothetical protein ACLPT6_12140 [Desulfobaccales bacterium]|jgi:hypothetical protein
MADTIKTQLMQSLAAALAAIPEIRTVERRHPVGYDLDRGDLPVLFLYEKNETGRRANRLRLGTIHVEMATWVKLLPQSKDPGYQAFYDQADAIAGEVWALIQRQPGILIAQEDLRRPAIGNDNLGELILQYRITYGHAVGDAFTTQV